MIGITMRMTREPATGEERDALAHDWARFFSILLPGAPWIMLPNVGGGCVDLARDVGVDGLVLSGGDDIGATPRRDTTETALLRWAADERLPVLGVCRGMQMLQRFLGGGLVELDAGRHIRARHAILWRDDAGEERREVNSFHRNGISPSILAQDLHVLARCEADGSVEAAESLNPPWLGIMWHPEREREPHPADLGRIRRLFRRSGA